MKIVPIILSLTICYHCFSQNIVKIENEPVNLDTVTNLNGNGKKLLTQFPDDKNYQKVERYLFSSFNQIYLGIGTFITKGINDCEGEFNLKTKDGTVLWSFIKKQYFPYNSYIDENGFTHIIWSNPTSEGAIPNYVISFDPIGNIIFQDSCINHFYTGRDKRIIYYTKDPMYSDTIHGNILYCYNSIAKRKWRLSLCSDIENNILYGNVSDNGSVILCGNLTDRYLINDNGLILWKIPISRINWINHSIDGKYLILLINENYQIIENSSGKILKESPVNIIDGDNYPKYCCFVQNTDYQYAIGTFEKNSNGQLINIYNFYGTVIKTIFFKRLQGISYEINIDFIKNKYVVYAGGSIVGEF